MHLVPYKLLLQFFFSIGLCFFQERFESSKRDDEKRFNATNTYTFEPLAEASTVLIKCGYHSKQSQTAPYTRL